MNEPIDISGDVLHIVQWDRELETAKHRAETLYTFCLEHSGLAIDGKRTRELTELRAHEGLAGYLITADLRKKPFERTMNFQPVPEEKPLTNEEAYVATHREEIEAIDTRVYQFTKQFQDVTNLLTTLFERQMDLEELMKEQSTLIKQYKDASLDQGRFVAALPSLREVEELQTRAKDLLEQTVK